MNSYMIIGIGLFVIIWIAVVYIIIRCFHMIKANDKIQSDHFRYLIGDDSIEDIYDN